MRVRDRPSTTELLGKRKHRQGKVVQERKTQPTCFARQGECRIDLLARSMSELHNVVKRHLVLAAFPDLFFEMSIVCAEIPAPHGDGSR